jgi:glycosyltransferase involved in cell wall biosynthesis
MKRILIYADADLNLIDGSAVWLASLTEMLSGEETFFVDVLLKRRLERDLLVHHLIDHPRVRFLCPWGLAESDLELRVLLERFGDVRLDVLMASELILRLHQESAYDRILIRGAGILAHLSAVSEIANIGIAYVTNPNAYTDWGQHQELVSIHRQFDTTFCQTELARKAIIELLGPDANLGRIDILNPMVPDANFDLPLGRKRIRMALGYSGKFSPPYMIEEMLEAHRRIRQTRPDATLHVIGDKFHNRPYVEGFEERVRASLQEEAGVHWHGGVGREEANRLVSEMEVASGWRDPSFDSTVEMSTKVLEYAALGIPVLMRPARVQRDIFDDDLPIWVTSEDTFVDAYTALIEDAELRRSTAERMREAVREYSFSSTLSRLRHHFADSGGAS